MSFRAPGLDIKVTNSSIIGSVILIVVLTGLALYSLQLPIVEAIAWGTAAMLLVWIGEIIHQYGHAMAARRVGYPMTGVRLWWIFGASQYPRDEPTLPATVHIRRALGGPAISIGVGIVLSILALLIKDSLSAPLWGLFVFFAFLNLGYYGLGAFLPLGFTDGSTLLRYWNKP